MATARIPSPEELEERVLIALGEFAEAGFSTADGKFLQGIKDVLRMVAQIEQLRAMRAEIGMARTRS